MKFLESPSPVASVATWERWAARLNKLNPHDKTVIAEKQRAQRIIEQLREEDELDRVAALA